MSSTSIGISITVLASLTYAILSALVKANVHGIPIIQIAFIQNLVTFLLVVAHNRVIPSEKRISFKTNRIGIHIFRACLGLFGVMFLYYLSMRFISLSDAVVLQSTSALFIPIISLVLLGQRISKKLWLPIMCGYMGVILILRPDEGIFKAGALFGLLSGLSVGSIFVLLGRMTTTEPITRIMFYYSLFAMLISGFISFFYWNILPTYLLMMLIFTGVLFWTYQYLIYSALKYMAPHIVGTLSYLTVVFSIIITLVFFKHKPPLLNYVGILLIILGGIGTILLRDEKPVTKK